MKKILNPWVIAGTIITASLLLVITFLVSGTFFTGNQEPYQGGAVITIIPVPTATHTPQPTSSPPSLPSPTVESVDGIRQGGYAQISGTEGEGLRLRIEPSLSGEIVYLGLEGEIFLVKSGPVDQDGYLWWQLEAPLNETRVGWAVSNYLQPAQSP